MSGDRTIPSLRGRIGAYAVHARHDSRALTAHAREEFLARFEREVDPDGVLTLTERARRTSHARKAYFARLALRSAQARKGAATVPSGDDRS